MTLNTEGNRQQAEKPHVLLLVTLSEWGGAQHIVYLLARYLRADYEITVGCAPGGELVDKLTQEGIRVVSIPEFTRNLHPLKDLRALWRLYCFIKSERFDLVHAHSTKAGLIGRLAARLAGIRSIVFSAHGWPFTEGRSLWKRRLLALMERVAAYCSTKIVCVSEHDRQLALKFNVARPAKLIVIHNGLDPQPFLQADGARVKQQLGLDKCLALTFVGRLAPPKEPLVLLTALQKLPNAKVILVGEGPMRPEIEQFVKRNQLEDRVMMLGMREDVPEILAASDVFVLPSRWEGLPLVIIEAIFAGLPVVATRVGGISELVEEGVNGWLIPRSDPRAMAQALQRLTEDEFRRKQMGKAGREKALEQFTLERMVAQYRELYRDLLTSR